MSKELLNTILKGTKEYSNRKEINESSLLFEKVKIEIIKNNEILSSIENTLNIKPDSYSEIGIYSDIESIEKLLNPNYIHSNEKKRIYKQNEKGLKKFNEGIIPSTAKDILTNLLHHLNIQIKALNSISKEIELSTNYPYASFIIRK